MWDRDIGAKGRRVRGASGDGVGFRRSASTEGILNIVSIAMFTEEPLVLKLRPSVVSASQAAGFYGF